jgi:hypothetical protein
MLAALSRAPRHAEVNPRSELVLVAALASLLLAVPEAWGQPEATGRAPSSVGGEDALLREIDEARRLERLYREQQQAEAAAQKTARESEREARDRAAREKERAESAHYESETSHELGVQQDLLWAVTGRGEAPEGGIESVIPARAMPSEAAGDPRIADPAPKPRELPAGIFDRTKIEIARGEWENEERLRVVRLELDADGDGKPELIRYLDRETDALLRQEEDRNYDGVIDAWTRYENGKVTTRVLDSNDDGNPDLWESYRDGRLEAREGDRDDDGVRDVFYRYRGESLSEEKHDANNDGQIDLVIVYQDRRRVRAHEDVDRDGRMDVWTSYAKGAKDGGAEHVIRIDRDVQGRGFADTFEIFEIRDGKAEIVRREEDRNGDGSVDVISFYESGKLRRRLITDPDAVSM